MIVIPESCLKYCILNVNACCICNRGAISSVLNIGLRFQFYTKKYFKKRVKIQKYVFISLILRLLQKGEKKGGNNQYSYSICALLGRRGDKTVQ